MGAAATKCLVCGADLSLGNTGRHAAVGARGRSAAMPRVALPMPLLLGLIFVLLLAGGGLLFLAMGDGLPAGIGDRSTPTLTPTATFLPTITPLPTDTETPMPTPTPLPPVDYTIVDGDTCIKIALDFQVSVASIVEANAGLIDPNCNFLTRGLTIKVPQPTYTPTPLPSATLPANVQAQPTSFVYVVKSGETLAGIARFFGVSVADLMAENGITDPNSIREGQPLIIPSNKIVTPGPTPTPSPLPPYPAPNLLLPNDGAVFAADDVITLQWTSIGELRTAEFYYVSIEDVTCGCALIRQFTTAETKFIVPAEMRPASTSLFRWSVNTVRQTNFGETGAPVYQPAGAASPERGFIWLAP